MRQANESSTASRPWSRWIVLPLTALLLSVGQGFAGDEPPTLPPALTPTLPPNDTCFYPEYGPCDYFVRGGAVLPLSKGALENVLEIGWTIQAGVRKPLCCPHPWLDLFGELAGFYGNNHGDGTFVVTSGVVNEGPGQIDLDGTDTIQLGAQRTEIDNYLNTRINSIERYGIQFAIGSYYLAPQFPIHGWQFFSGSTQFSWRGGIRAGGIRVQYEQYPTDFLNAFLRQSNNEDREPLGLRFTSNVKQPELFIGAFAAAGIGTTWDRLGGYDCAMTLTAEVEAAIDYVNTGDYAKGDKGLGTWSPTLSLTFAW